MGRHAFLMASLALTACFSTCYAITNQAEMAYWAMGVSVTTAGPVNPGRRFLAEKPKAMPIDCGACVSTPPDKLSTQLGKAGFTCPKTEGQLTQALKSHNRASALHICCGKTLPATMSMGSSDKDIKAFVDKLVETYECTDMSAYHVQVEKGTGSLNEAGTVISCRRPKTVFQCV